jgi:hypothetical protein
MCELPLSLHAKRVVVTACAAVMLVRVAALQAKQISYYF